MILTEEHREELYRRWRDGESSSSTLVELFDAAEKGLIDWSLSKEPESEEQNKPPT